MLHGKRWMAVVEVSIVYKGVLSIGFNLRLRSDCTVIFNYIVMASLT